MRLVAYIEPFLNESFTIPIYQNKSEFYFHRLDKSFKIIDFEKANIIPNYLKMVDSILECEIGDFGIVVYAGEHDLFVGPANVITTEILIYRNRLKLSLKSINSELELLKRAFDYQNSVKHFEYHDLFQPTKVRKRIKGTPVGKIRRVTTSVMGSFLTDLNVLESTGYDDQTCSLVKNKLNEVYEHLQSRASSVWLSELVLDFGDFHDAYSRWNGVGTSSSEEARYMRRESLMELRKMRKGWARQTLKNFDKDFAFDEKVASFSDEAIKELGVIASEYPKYFKNLKGSIAAYYKYT